MISSHRMRAISIKIAPFGDAYEKIGTIQRRLAWPLHKDDTLSRSGRPTGLNIYLSFSFQFESHVVIGMRCLGAAPGDVGNSSESSTCLLRSFQTLVVPHKRTCIHIHAATVPVLQYSYTLQLHVARRRQNISVAAPRTTPSFSPS